MHTIGKALLLLCSLTSAGEIAAQTVSGKLIDENKQPLPYANVVLLTLPDSTFVTGTVTAEDGAPDKPCGVGRADANPKLLLNDT